VASTIDDIISAAVRGDVERVAALVRQDPTLGSAANMTGATAIHAAHYAGHPQVVRLLVPASRALDAFLAAELGLESELESFLKRNPNLVTERSPAGFTALHGACYWGSVGCARLLLDSGAAVRVATADPFLQIHPLGCAVASPDVPNPSQDEAVVLQLVNLLIERGAEVNAHRRDGMTALHAAAWRGHLQVVRRLLDAGADTAIRANEDAGPHAGQTAADTARAQGQVAAADLLGAEALNRRAAQGKEALK
jgi:uncharacterized protein